MNHAYRNNFPKISKRTKTSHQSKSTKIEYDPKKRCRST